MGIYIRRKLLLCAMSIITACDICMADNIHELPAVTVYPLKKYAIHMLGYVREYATLSSYVDTIVLFREKKVDFLIPSAKAKNITGWYRPRLLASRSYYRFKNIHGLDSVSDSFRGHFSWSDWIELPPTARLSSALSEVESGIDSLSAHNNIISQIWTKQQDNVNVHVNILAGNNNRSWVAPIARAFMDDLDFSSMTLDCRYEDITGEILTPDLLSYYTLNLSSAGRGDALTHAFKTLGQVYIDSKVELYITDRTILSEKQARKLIKQEVEDKSIIPPSDAGTLSPEVQSLVARVNGIDKDYLRRNIIPDSRLAGIEDLFKTRRNTWQKLWDLISPPRYQINTTTFPNH